MLSQQFFNVVSYDTSVINILHTHTQGTEEWKAEGGVAAGACSYLGQLIPHHDLWSDKICQNNSMGSSKVTIGN